MNFLLLSLGAAFGAIARHKLGEIILKHNKHNFPLGTLLINLTGALLLGIFCGSGLSGNPYLLLGDGFCGAFTTFSTFSVESVRLIQGKSGKKAVLYIALSVLIGLVCFYTGYTAVTIFAG